jgi:hypothetical protein
MLRDGKPNPLNVHGLRQLDHCPPHFELVSFELRANRKEISDWIWENLEGRFWFDDYYFVNESSGAVEMETCAAFEIHSEASMFAICLSQFNDYKFI